MVEQSVEKVVPGGLATENRSSGDGFTLVGRSNRRMAAPVRNGAFVAGSSNANTGKNLRDISGRVNTESITITNSFSSLEDDSIPSDRREVAISVEGNKENFDISKQSRNGKSIAHVNTKFVSGPSDKGKNGSKFNGLDKRAGENRSGGPNGPKLKQNKNNRPTRGFVFGQIRTETELAVSGKRMRVEANSEGRLGGVFAASGAVGTDLSSVNEETTLAVVVAESDQNNETQMQMESSEMASHLSSE